MDDARRCIYILPKKKRRCKMLVKKGRSYCGEHAIYDPYNQERVRCPIDPKHTVNKAELESHLKKRCNGRLPDVPWVVKGLNSTIDYGKIEPDHVAMQETLFHDHLYFYEFIRKIRATYDDIAHEVSDLRMKTSLIEEFMNESKVMSENHRKHLAQHSSIIGHLTEAGLLFNNESLCIIDFGAGKAELPYWIAKDFQNCRFLLLDMQGMRNKYDNKAIKENPVISMERIRCSIEHLDLSKIKVAKEAETVVAICKHLCGKATDWSIKCLENGLKNGVNLLGFALAPCCHHKSEYSEYRGKDFLASNGFASESEFLFLKRVASWAICGLMSRELSKEQVGLSRDEKVSLGRQAKVLLEFGRVAYMRQMGYTIKLYQYVGFDISPENLLLVGKMNTHP